jgi:hypothetical protein
MSSLLTAGSSHGSGAAGDKENNSKKLPYITVNTSLEQRSFQARREFGREIISNDN